MATLNTTDKNMTKMIMNTVNNAYKNIKLKPAAALVCGVLALGSVITLALPRDSVAADDKKGAATVKPALTVTTTKPSPAKLAIKLAANGNVAAWQEAVIGSESGGLRLTD